jgi:putative endonuclease
VGTRKPVAKLSKNDGGKWCGLRVDFASYQDINVFRIDTP